MGTAWDCHQFAPRHGPSEKALRLKLIGWLEGVKKSGTVTSGVLRRHVEPMKSSAAVDCPQHFFTPSSTRFFATFTSTTGC